MDKVLLNECRGTRASSPEHRLTSTQSQRWMLWSQLSGFLSQTPQYSDSSGALGGWGLSLGRGSRAPRGQDDPAPSSCARCALTPRSCPASVPELIASRAQRLLPTSPLGPSAALSPSRLASPCPAAARPLLPAGPSRPSGCPPGI